MREFRRRIYRRPGELYRDLREIVSRRHLLRSSEEDRIEPAFRERLMLAVTAVNGCRYCSYAHARQALAAGVSGEEIARLARGVFQGSPAGEIPALLYAQHWAENDGRADPQVRASILERYGEHRVARIEVFLRMIRVGNLLGNTFDYALYRASFGHFGGARADSAT